MPLGPEYPDGHFNNFRGETAANGRTGRSKMLMDPFTKSRRSMLKTVVNVVGLSAASRFLPLGNDGISAFAQGSKEPEKKEGKKGSTLILLGTQGGPGVTLTRSQPASLLLIGNQGYLIDCGYGTLRALVQSESGFNNISNIFMTHLHNDHTSDLAALLSHKWTSGRAQATAVYGPYGTAAMVKGALAFFQGDTEIRTVNEGRTVKPESIFSGKDLDVSGVIEVFRDENVVVKAVQNTHYPERNLKQMPHRSFGYRFDLADRSIVFSGDTAYSSGVVELAKDADIFVCETMGLPRRQQEAQIAKDIAENKESIGRHVVETHSTTDVVGRMATEAKVKMVVLNHLIGGGTTPSAMESFEKSLAESVSKYFTGKVIAGRDQMRF
jgi:ribonuclease BN (tRNA processing enzyme)